ncbi:MAG: DUF5455 family protein [Pseudohongiella sp.]|nr:DUF5455 family protein [Pseudohongiella sp.]
MPLPLLPAVPALPALTATALKLGSTIVASVSGLIAFAGSMITARVGLVAAAVAAITALTIALIAVFTNLASSIQVAIPASAVEFAAAFFPGNLTTCVSVLVSAQAARWVFQRNVEVVKMLVK